METIPILSQKFPYLVCKDPLGFDARSVKSGLPFDPTLPNIQFDKRGLKCCPRFGRECDDYEVRFCCPNRKYNRPVSVKTKTDRLAQK